MNLRALIFDLDGVLADTLKLHYRSWKRLGDEEQIPFSWRDFDRALGLTRRSALDVFLNGRVVSEATVQDYLRRKNAYFHEYLQDLSPADTAPGVADLIADARAAGLKIGLGSSSANARLVLSRLGLLDQFDAIGDGNTPVASKPAPDIYQYVANCLDVHPSEAVVFEDSDAGVQAGLAGGFYVVGIGSTRVAGAHLIVPSLAGIRVATLRERLAALSA